MESSLVFGTTLAHSLSSARMLLDLGHGEVFAELERQGLGVGTHGADPDAQAVHDDVVLAGGAQDLVGLDPGLPLFLGLAVAQVRVDPGDQGAGQRHAELGGVDVGALVRQDLAVDFEDGRRRVVQFRADLGVERAELAEQLAHVPGAAAGGSLVGHGRAPLDEAVLEQPAEAHQHAGHGAVAADEVLGAVDQALVDDVAVDGVQHDDRVVVHAQGGGGVDPEAVPAAAAQLAVDLLGVVPALGGDNNGQLRQRVDVERVLELAGAPAAAPARDGAAPPALDVEKNTGLMLAKSPSSCMRCIRTEPTMPRHPTRPTEGVAAVVIRTV